MVKCDARRVHTGRLEVMRCTVIELRCRSRHDEGDVAPIRPPTYADSCVSGEIEIDFMNVNHVRSYTECVIGLHAMLLTFIRTSTLSLSTTTRVDSTQILCVHFPQTHTHTHTRSLSLTHTQMHTDTQISHANILWTQCSEAMTSQT